MRRPACNHRDPAAMEVQASPPLVMRQYRLESVVDQKRYRQWIGLGIASGTVALIMFVVLATQVFATDPETTPKVTLVAVTVVLLGTLAGFLIFGAIICRTLAESREEHGQLRWWQGYAASVKDTKTDAEIIQIPAARNGRGL